MHYFKCRYWNHLEVVYLSIDIYRFWGGCSENCLLHIYFEESFTYIFYDITLYEHKWKNRGKQLFNIIEVSSQTKDI